MAQYKVRFTVYKDPEGKTLKGPTFVHFIGDLCSAVGLMGIIWAILAVTEEWGTGRLIGGVVAAIAGFVLYVVLHKQAKKSAEEAVAKALARQEGRTTGKSN